MTTIAKTVRIDEELIDIIDDYRKIVRRLWGVDPSHNQIIEGCIIRGMKDNLQFFSMVKSGACKELRDDEGNLMELPSEAFALLDRYEKYRSVYFDGNDSNIEIVRDI